VQPYLVMAKIEILQQLDACNEFLALNGYEHPLSPVIGAHKASIMRVNGFRSSIDLVLDVVASVTGVNEQRIKSKPRGKQPVTDARHIFCKICKEELGLSLAFIGEYLSGRDHSTVINSLDKSLDLLVTDKEFSRLYQKSLEKYRSLISLTKAEPATIEKMNHYPSDHE
jgi:chromosomal replication initiation ATPase DnaA